MKNSILKGIVLILIILFLGIGFIPGVKDFLTYDQYMEVVIWIVFIIFEILLYLKLHVRIKTPFRLMEEDINFRKYKKEEKYREDKSFYYRDLPNMDLFRIFWIGFQYNLVENRANLLNALLLKWCMEDRIRFLNNDTYEISSNQNEFDNVFEAELFQMLIDSSKNGLMKLTLFNSKPVLQKINHILLTETSELRGEGKIVRVNGDDVISGTIKGDVDILFGFRNFLLNFGSIEDKRPMEVQLWEEYLIYAELLGIADQVKREFKKAGIDYSSREKKFKRINRKIVNRIKVLTVISYLFYGLIFLVLTSWFWMIYIKLTWNL